MDDTVSLLLYVLMILAAFIASAYQAKKRKAQQRQGPVVTGNEADREAGGRPDLGPLGDFFDMQDRRENPPDYETLEEGPSVEEAGAETERSVVYEPLAYGNTGIPDRPAEKEVVSTAAFFEEGQSDLTHMSMPDEISGYLYKEEELEEISAGEIVSVEKEAEALAKKGKPERPDWRKAIIYSEILKRREY